MEVIKKAVSTLITVCLVVGVANIPAYAGVTAISATKTTNEILSKAYTTPAQAAEKAIKSSKSSNTNVKYAVELKDFMTGLKKGEKAVVDVKKIME